VPIVLDANVAVDWFLPNVNDVASTALDLIVSDGAVVPMLWRWEVQDVLRRLNLAGKLVKPVDYIRAELRELPIMLDEARSGLFGGEASIANRYNLSVYDAAYLELAIRLHAPMATNDRALAAAVENAKLPPIRGTRS
jgi:predicted nucleic acid-binding protein